MSYYFQVIESTPDWELLLKTFKDPDVYYTREYGNLFAKMEIGQLHAAFYKDELSKVFYPFIKRKVDWAGEEIYDIVTPYGYGGPLLEGSEQSIRSFYDCFTDYCNENNIITETIRFHPIIRNYEVCKNIMDVAYIRKTTAVDLTLSIEEIREHYSVMNKRNLTRARKGGLFCFLAENTVENIRQFIGLYQETMNRNEADGFYYFTEDYFFQQMESTSISDSYLLFAKYKSEIVAGVLVMKGLHFSHYHLGASKTSYLHLKPNNLLFDFMIEFCQSKGSTLLHLGGGYQENDGLFKFKSSFTNNNSFEYFIGKRVYNQEIYNKIIEDVKSRYKVNEQYFPIYRGKREQLIDYRASL